MPWPSGQALDDIKRTSFAVPTEIVGYKTLVFRTSLADEPKWTKELAHARGS